MRDDIRHQLSLHESQLERGNGFSGEVPDHMGLAYTQYAPVSTQPGEDKGKIPDEYADDWFDELESWRLPDGYDRFLDRWKESLRADHSRAFDGTLDSRLLVGQGLPSPVEVGLRVHHTWGVPVIPGSALKGLLAQYVQTVYGPEDPQNHPLEAESDGVSIERSKFQGVTWNDTTIKHGPGEVYRALFGAPDAKSDERIREDHDAPEEGRLPVGAEKGKVTFHDALVVSRGDAGFFGRDVVTVHQKTYYRNDGGAPQDGDCWPNDYDAPNPVNFLTVVPGVTFRFALSGPPDWTEFAAELLKEALAEWGVGGKTTSGYGRFDAERWRPMIRPRKILARESALYDDIDRWFDENPRDDRSLADQLEGFEANYRDYILGEQFDADDRDVARLGAWMAIDEHVPSGDSRTRDFRDRWSEVLRENHIDPETWGLQPGDDLFPEERFSEEALDIGRWLSTWAAEHPPEDYGEETEWSRARIEELSSDFQDRWFLELAETKHEEGFPDEVVALAELIVPPPSEANTEPFYENTLREILETDW